MAEIIHPFYESHRGAMEAAMRHRLDLAEAMLCERAHLSNIDGIRQEVMDEFEIVLTQMPYVGGAASRKERYKKPSGRVSARFCLRFRRAGPG